MALQDYNIIPALGATIIHHVHGKLKERDASESLIITQPDNTRPIGVGDNLARTALQLASAENLGKEQVRKAYVSHIPFVEENTKEKGIYIVFETPVEGHLPRSVTRQYVTPEYMDYCLVKVGYRLQQQAVNDVLEFLTNGVVPA